MLARIIHHDSLNATSWPELGQLNRLQTDPNTRIRPRSIATEDGSFP